MNGCELRKCTYYKDSKCTDDEPLYELICRYNHYWQTKEGIAEIEEHEGVQQ